MSLVIVQSGVAEWREVPILSPTGRVIGNDLKPFHCLTGEEADWAVQRGSQELFLNNTDFEVLYGGNRGGGKTACLLMDFAQDCGRGFGMDWKGILFRHSYPELKDIVDKSKALFPILFPGIKFNETKMTWTWPTGEQLLLRHMERESDYMSYHGHAYPWIGWEELTTWADSGCYTRMMSCCRSTNPLVPRKVRSTTNPYGPGFNWVKARFQLPLAPGSMYGPLIEDEETGNRRYINSDLRENLVLLNADPDYIKRIKASARNAAELAAWLHGSWDITSGGMFDDIWFQVKDHLVLPPFQVPLSWRIDRSYDWGSSRPFSVGWWAQSDGTDLILPGNIRMPTVRGDLFRVKEWYGWDGKTPNKGSKMLAKDIATGIIQREIEWGIHGRVRRGIADAAIFDDSSGDSIARQMERVVRIDGKQYPGVYFNPSNKRSGSRKQGWEVMRIRMKSTKPAELGHPREEPGLFVTSDCVHFLRTVPTLPRDTKDLDDVDTDAEDHIADETRYRCLAEDRTIRGGTTSGIA